MRYTHHTYTTHTLRMYTVKRQTSDRNAQLIDIYHDTLNYLYEFPAALTIVYRGLLTSKHYAIPQRFETEMSVLVVNQDCLEVATTDKDDFEHIFMEEFRTIKPENHMIPTLQTTYGQSVGSALQWRSRAIRMERIWNIQRPVLIWRVDRLARVQSRSSDLHDLYTMHNPHSHSPHLHNHHNPHPNNAPDRPKWLF